MQQLLGDSVGLKPDSRFLCKLFLQRLPYHVGMVLAAAGDMSLEALAQLADKVMEVATYTILAVHVPSLAPELGGTATGRGRATTQPGRSTTGTGCSLL